MPPLRRWVTDGQLGVRLTMEMIPHLEHLLPRLPAALRHRDYRIYWIGQTISSVGSQFSLVAMAWQMYELTDSPLQLGLIGLARALPRMALVLVGGLLADAVDRRRLLMVTQAGQMSVSVGLIVATVAG